MSELHVVSTTLPALQIGNKIHVYNSQALFCVSLPTAAQTDVPG